MPAFPAMPESLAWEECWRFWQSSWVSIYGIARMTAFYYVMP
jgi:hypothetical protein